jgi:Na+/H+ antiporter NhaD/arsenite permease-like protein
VQNAYIVVSIFAIVYFLIIFGRGKFKIPIWTSMLIGAAFMIGFQIISIESAFKSINLDVIGFLFGMFSIVSALDISGVLKVISVKMLSMTNNNPDLILMVFVVGMGLLSAFLVNDTIALLGIPLIISITRQIDIRPQILLIALSFGITIGSTMTPIGNPQNLLIALQSGIPLPFITFIKVLGIPTIINLFITFFILKIYFKNDLVMASSSPSSMTVATAAATTLFPNYHYKPSRQQQKHQHNLKDNSLNKNKQKNPQNDISESEPVLFNNPSHISKDTEGAKADDNVIVNPLLAKISIAVLLITISGFIITEILQFVFHFVNNFSISIVAMLGATILYAFSKERREILASIDYSVLIFFAAMFVFTSAIWSSGIISQIISYFPTPDKHDIFQSNATISVISIALSQILSNVPFVVVYNHVMLSNGFASGIISSNGYISQWMMLAAGSTVSGNLTILAAASNIIIIEAAESKGLKSFSFLEFFKVGVIITIVNIVIYYIFIVMLFS